MSRSIGAIGLLLVALALAGPLVSAESPLQLGRVYPRTPDGIDLRPGGDPLLGAPEIVKTYSHAAEVRLDNGALLQLGSSTAAIFAAAAGDAVDVTVLSGSVSMIDRLGRRVGGGAGSRFLLTPMERGEIAPAEIDADEFEDDEISGTGRRVERRGGSR